MIICVLVYTTDKISINKQLESINTELRVWSDRKFNVFERLAGNGLFLQHFHIVILCFLQCDAKEGHGMGDAWILHWYPWIIWLSHMWGMVSPLCWVCVITRKYRFIFYIKNVCFHFKIHILFCPYV